MSAAASCSSVGHYNIVEFNQHLHSLYQFALSNNRNQMGRIRSVLTKSLQIQTVSANAVQTSRKEIASWGWKESILTNIDYIHAVLGQQPQCEFYDEAVNQVTNALSQLNPYPHQTSNEPKATSAPSHIRKLQGSVASLQSETDTASTLSSTSTRRHTGSKKSKRSKKTEKLRSAVVGLTQEKDRNQELSQQIAILQGHIMQGQGHLLRSEGALRQKEEELRQLQQKFHELQLEHLKSTLAAPLQPQQSAVSNQVTEVTALQQQLQEALKTISTLRPLEDAYNQLKNDYDALYSQYQALMSNNLWLQEQFRQAQGQSFNPYLHQPLTPVFIPVMAPQMQGTSQNNDETQYRR